jgi:hypothetical protein
LFNIFNINFEKHDYKSRLAYLQHSKRCFEEVKNKNVEKAKRTFFLHMGNGAIWQPYIN